MSDAIDPVILSLLTRRRELRDQGLDSTPEELCRDCPHLLSAFREAVNVSDKAEGWLAPRDTPTTDETGPYVPMASIPAPPWAEFGGRLGDVRPFAAGGMGEVLLATDPHLKADVIVKVIHARLAGSPDLVNRFLWEARVTARLNHPGVPAVHGAGTTADGRPCYAMRFIAGREMGEAIDEVHRTGRPAAGDPAFRDLLGRFVAVCQTVGYAHLRGVVHRDLKPRNIRLGEFGETVVLDWGLAKADGQGPPGVDEGGAVLGTRGYMAPEQADGRQDEVDERSDVFALGAILARIVGEAGPKPLLAVAARATDPLPSRRYQSAQALAADVERWLADEPVSEYRDRLPVRLARRARKNPIVTTALAVAAVALAIGLPVVLKKEAETARQRDKVTEERDLKDAARKEAVENLGLAKKNAEAARAREKIARESLDATSANVLDLLGRQKVLQPDQIAFLQKMYDLNERLAAHAGADEQGRAAAAAATVRMGSIQAQLGKSAKAEAAFRDALAAYARLVRDVPGNPAYKAALARAHGDRGLRLREQGQLDEAQACFREATAIFKELSVAAPDDLEPARMLAQLHDVQGDIHREASRFPEAAAEFGAAIRIRAGLVAKHAGNDSLRQELAMSTGNLALVRDKEGNYPEAERVAGQAMAVFKALHRKDPTDVGYRLSLAKGYLNLGTIYSKLRKNDEAIGMYDSAADVYRGLCGEFPSIPDYGHQLALTLASLGAMCRVTFQAERAGQVLRQAEDHARATVDRNPERLAYRQALAETRTNLGAALIELREWADAEAALQKALAGFRDLEARQGPSVEVGEGIAVAGRDLAILLDRTDRLPAAEDQFRASLAASAAVRRLAPSAPDGLLIEAKTRVAWADALVRRGRPTDALAELDSVADLLGPLLRADPTPPEARELRRSLLIGRAIALGRLGRRAEALARMEEAMPPPAVRNSMFPYVHGIGLIRIGEVGQGLSEIKRLAGHKDRQPMKGFMLACAYARAAEAAEPAGWLGAIFREVFARQAIAALRQAREEKWFDDQGGRDLLVAEPDLEPVRNREDFKQFRKEVNARAAPKK